MSNGTVRRHRTPTPRWAWLRANRGAFDVEHFKSQAGGSGPKRARQAQGDRTIVEDLVAAGNATSWSQAT